MTLKITYFAAIVGLCVGATELAAATQKTTPQADFAARLKAASVETRSIECDFTLVRTMSFMASEVTSRGRFHYLRDEGIFLAFTQPAGESITMGREGFKIVAGGRTTVVRSDSNPALRQLRAMLTACMTGDVEMLRRGGAVSISDVGSAWVVAIVPGGGRSKSPVRGITLTFEKVHTSLIELRMEESSGDVSLYRFTGKKFNVAVDAELFKI